MIIQTFFLDIFSTQWKLYFLIDPVFIFVKAYLFFPFVEVKIIKIKVYFTVFTQFFHLYIDFFMILFSIR